MQGGKGFYTTILTSEESHPVTALQTVLVSIHTLKRVHPTQTRRSSAPPGFSKGVQSTKRNQTEDHQSKSVQGKSAPRMLAFIIMFIHDNLEWISSLCWFAIDQEVVRLKRSHFRWIGPEKSLSNKVKVRFGGEPGPRASVQCFLVAVMQKDQDGLLQQPVCVERQEWISPSRWTGVNRHEHSVK